MRRAFIAGFGSAAVWPLAAAAQQPGRVWRVGLLALMMLSTCQQGENASAKLRSAASGRSGE
jgi:hypothetical protein